MQSICCINLNNLKVYSKKYTLDLLSLNKTSNLSTLFTPEKRMMKERTKRDRKTRKKKKNKQKGIVPFLNFKIQ
jgi:hypothetical protein